MPARHLQKQPSNGWPQQCAKGLEKHGRSQIICLSAARHIAINHRHRRWNDDAATDPFEKAKNNQHEEIHRKRTAQRTKAERAHRRQEHRAIAEALAKIFTQRHDHSKRQHIAGDHPLNRVDVNMEHRHVGRQRNCHRRRIEHGHDPRQEDREQKYP